MRKLKMTEAFIMKYARAIRHIQEEQISEYEELILKELAKLVPTLPDEGQDWLCDILSCGDDEEVIETLDRIRDIEERRLASENNNSDDQIRAFENRIQRMSDYIRQLEDRIDQLENRYEEPTN